MPKAPQPDLALLPSSPASPGNTSSQSDPSLRATRIPILISPPPQAFRPRASALSGADSKLPRPIAFPSAVAGQDWSNLRTNDGQSALTIVLVDDDPAIRNLLQTFLERQGAKVYCAAGATEAMTLLERTVPDILISDIQLGEFDGLRLIAELREKHPSVATIAISGRNEGLTWTKSSPDAFLPKPFLLRKLFEVIRSLVSS
jgi:CheY-like chemotaxis protein